MSLFVLCLQNQSVFAQADHVVISEIYGGGGNSGSTYKNDFIELYNPTESAISVAGWSVQYTSASGPNNTPPKWDVTALSGSIAARSYYLIRQSSGGANGTLDLPEPYVSGTIAMAAGAGKVALCNTVTPLTVSNPAATLYIDLVGYGTTANFSEGNNAPATNAPVPNASSSIERKVKLSSTAASLTAAEALLGNGYDSNDNSTDFVTQPNENPQTSESPQEPATPSTDPTISVSPAAVDFGDENININSPEETFVVTYANLTGSDVTLNVDAPFSISKTSGGSFVQTLTYALADLAGTSFTVYARANLSSSGAVSKSVTFSGGGDETPPNVTLNANGIDFSIVTRINTIQGSGLSATSGSYTIRGIVTAIYPSWNPAGYYIQSEAADDDNDPATSEGIFVAQNDPGSAVNAGDLVRVSGKVVENSATPSFGQAIITPALFSVISNGNLLPNPVTVSLPVTTATFLERYEGMLVQFTNVLTVTDNFDLGTFGSISLSQGGLVYQPTQLVDPNDATASGTTSTGASNVASVTALQTANAMRTIILDDGSAITPASLPYVNASNTLRLGSTINSVTGILGYGYSAYRIQPVPSSPVVFTHAVRPSSVPGVGAANLKVASFNVLNYFNGNGDETGFPTSRGASSLNEFNRQRAKIISALSLINADVVGLIEIENDGVAPASAIADLVNGLNLVLGADTYAFVNDATVPNTDAIRCAIIYKPAAVSPSGSVMTSSNTVFNRPPVAQNFQILSPGGRTTASDEFTYIINHFKSKSCSGASGANTDQLDGQVCYNESRKQQADALLSFISTTVVPTSGNSKIVSMGDYNAYYEEDPLDKLRAGGLQVLSEGTAYSYQFDGQVGSLDHALVSSALSPAVTGVAKWNINSLEPVYLGYEDGTDDDGNGDDQVNPWASTYTNDQFRSSDHDAVLVGLDFSKALPVELISFTAKSEGEKVLVRWATTSETNNSHFTVERAANGINFEEIARVDGAGDYSQLKNYQFTDLAPLNGKSYYRLKQFDFDGRLSVSRIVPVLTNLKSGIQFTVSPNPVTDNILLQINGADRQANFGYEIVNQNGNTITSGTGPVSIINQEANKILPELRTGIYLIRLRNGESSFVFRFLKY